MKKYAIYKSKTGYYYYEYHDTLESLKGTPFEALVTEDKLPVVIMRNGGYYTFTEDDYMFDRLVECDGVPLKLEEMFFKNQDTFKLGWMSPDGDTYSCSYTNHNKCAIMLARKFFPKAKYPETALERAGWLKIIDSWDGRERQHGQYVHSGNGKITRRQADKLFDLGLYDNHEVRQLIRDNDI